MYLTNMINEKRLPFAPASGVQLSSRSEHILDCTFVISKITERLLGVLLSSVENHTDIGCDALRPLWAMEAAERSQNFLRLSLLRQIRAKSNADDYLATGKEFALATRLADLYREIANVPERWKVLCSQALRSAVEYLVALFGPAVGRIDLETEIDPIVLPGFQRRALILAATDLIMRSLLKVSDEPEERQMLVTLRTVGTDRACIAVSDDGLPFQTAAAAGRQGSIADDMASLLTSNVVYQPFNERGVTAKITFPLHV